MYKIRCLNCSTSSVHSGIKFFAEYRTTSHRRWRSLIWDGFATFTWLYTKVTVRPQQNSPPPLSMITSCINHPRIQYVANLAIIRTRPLTSTTTLPPYPLHLLSCTISLDCSLLPLPAHPMRHPHPYSPPFMLTITSWTCHC